MLDLAFLSQLLGTLSSGDVLLSSDEFLLALHFTVSFAFSLLLSKGIKSLLFLEVSIGFLSSFDLVNLSSGALLFSFKLSLLLLDSGFSVLTF